MSVAELERLADDARRGSNWKRWGPYLSERQWGTVREDYSPNGDSWDYLTHDHARSRAYRWGEDGLLGICDRQARLCFALALWNEHDPILKERLFGLTGPEGNHGEDVKECYYYLDATPTGGYLHARYKYPQQEFPYDALVEENRRRGKFDGEYELEDTGIFDGDRYFDVDVEYAKAAPEDLLITLTVANRGPAAAPLHLLPTLWFRNTWSWGRHGHDQTTVKPSLHADGDLRIRAVHETLGDFVFAADATGFDTRPTLLFTENESNAERLFGSANPSPWVKDAFHRHIVDGERDAVNPAHTGTKAALHYVLDVPAGGEIVVRLRLTSAALATDAPFDASFEKVRAWRRADADAFHHALMPATASDEEHRIARQARAGLLWSKQFYHYVVADWLDGDPGEPQPPDERKHGRNADWRHVYNRDVISMPDTWEYPWYAAWDLAFHAIALGDLDPEFAKEQMLLLLREWYMHPNGQIPAYEFAFGDVNPPVHAWACWRLYKTTAMASGGERDGAFLSRAFHKLLINFTWWVNRKDLKGNHLFSGGFLGLDNIGVFDRSKPLPGGGLLEQADGTAWMAFYALTMLAMALELAQHDASYEDVASKFFEHFVAIADAMNTVGGTGLWDEQDGFYYDEIHTDGTETPLRLRSMVGLIPLFAVEVLDESRIATLPGFRKRMQWFLDNRPDLAGQIAITHPTRGGAHRLLAIPSRERLLRVLHYLLDESEFLSPYGIRSLSRVHLDHPFTIRLDGIEARVEYDPAESTTGLFGGNSNWRGPVWYPVNYLLIEALERYHHFFGDALTVECPTGSGRLMTLREVAHELSRRITSIFLPDANGQRPCHGGDARYGNDPHWRDLLLFHEYFHGDTGRGLGASHQTGWTALAARMLADIARMRTRAERQT